MEYYMDEKWKVSKDDGISRHSNQSTKMSRSASQRSSTTRSSSLHKNPFNLSRSSSTSSKSSSLSRSSSQKRSEFTRKCSNLAKEQKSKFYIVKRCITMLVGWKKNRDS